MVRMRILSRSILPLLRRPNAATSPAPMHCISSLSRPLISVTASGPARWWPSALARRVSPRTAAPNPPVRPVSRFLHGSRSMAISSGVNGVELVKPDRSAIPSANGVLISLGTKELIAGYGDGHGEEDERRASVNVISGEEDVGPMEILPNSSHSDGSIYRGTDSWKEEYHIADRNETRLESMMLSNPTDCCIRNGTCMTHTTRNMLQIFSLKLSKLPVDGGSVELYGYIAVRDNLDPLLNYIVNISRDHPIIIEQGSLLNMAGPKRGIESVDTILIEYDMRIKIGEQEKDDLQLIDGVSIVDDIDTWNCNVFTCRMHGGCGGIDITAARLHDAVEATVQVVISEVRGSFSMCLDCFTSGLQEEIRLFAGAIGESRRLKRSVVAVLFGAQMDLKLKVGTDSLNHAEHYCSFMSDMHGNATQDIKTDFALISVKVAWSALP